MRYQAPYGSTDPDASYVDRDTPAAVRGSVPPAAAIEDPQREIVGVIQAAGLTPEDGNQLGEAIQTGKLNYAVAGGTANAITLTLNPAPSALSIGMVIRILLSLTNTLTATVNVNGLGAIPTARTNGTATQAGDFVAGTIAELVYTGTAFQLTSPVRPPMSVQTVISLSGNFTVPAGITRIKYRLWGGGGGGGGGATTGGLLGAGTGGGGGGYSEGYVSVTPGQILACTVGAGGSFGPPSSAGGVGGTTAIAGVAQATGGSGGQYQSAASTVETNGGTGSLGNVNLNGGKGGIALRDGSTGNAIGGPGGNAAGGGGLGGVASSASPSVGLQPGGGGGGAGGTGGFNGGGGAQGLIIINY